MKRSLYTSPPSDNPKRARRVSGPSRMAPREVLKKMGSLVSAGDLAALGDIRAFKDLNNTASEVRRSEFLLLALENGHHDLVGRLLHFTITLSLEHVTTALSATDGYHLFWLLLTRRKNAVVQLLDANPSVILRLLEDSDMSLDALQLVYPHLNLETQFEILDTAYWCHECYLYGQLVRLLSPSLQRPTMLFYLYQAQIDGKMDVAIWNLARISDITHKEIGTYDFYTLSRITPDKSAGALVSELEAVLDDVYTDPRNLCLTLIAQVCHPEVINLVVSQSRRRHYQQARLLASASFSEDFPPFLQETLKAHPNFFRTGDILKVLHDILAYGDYVKAAMVLRRLPFDWERTASVAKHLARDRVLRCQLNLLSRLLRSEFNYVLCVIGEDPLNFFIKHRLVDFLFNPAAHFLLHSA